MCAWIGRGYHSGVSTVLRKEIERSLQMIEPNAIWIHWLTRSRKSWHEVAWIKTRHMSLRFAVLSVMKLAWIRRRGTISWSIVLSQIRPMKRWTVTAWCLFLPPPLGPAILKPDLKNKVTGHKRICKFGNSYLNPSFGQIKPDRKFFPREHIGIVWLFKCPLKLVQLKSCESCSRSSHFPRLASSILITCLVTRSVFIFIFLLSRTILAIFFSVFRSGMARNTSAAVWRSLVIKFFVSYTKENSDYELKYVFLFDNSKQDLSRVVKRI